MSVYLGESSRTWPTSSTTSCSISRTSSTRDATIKDLWIGLRDLHEPPPGASLAARRQPERGPASKFCRMLAALDSVHDFRSGRKVGLLVERILAFEGLAVADFEPCLQASYGSMDVPQRWKIMNRIHSWKSGIEQHSVVSSSSHSFHGVQTWTEVLGGMHTATKLRRTIPV